MDNSQQLDNAGEQRPQGRRRLGRFLIPHVTFAHDWRAALPIMAKVAILRAESLYHLDAIEYLAMCDDFEEISQGEAPPLYRLQYAQMESEGGEKFDTYTFVRE